METKPQVKHKQIVLIYKWAVVCFVLEELLPEVKEVKHLCSETLFGSYLILSLSVHIHQNKMKTY